MVKTIAILGVVGVVGYLAVTQIVPRLQAAASLTKPAATAKPSAAQQVDGWITATQNAFSLAQDVYGAVNGSSSKPAGIDAGGLGGLL